jgi:hypothetical protein
MFLVDSELAVAVRTSAQTKHANKTNAKSRDRREAIFFMVARFALFADTAKFLEKRGERVDFIFMILLFGTLM